MSLALLVIRLALGTIMFAHGAQKLLGWFGGPGVDGTLGFMGQMGIPALLAWAAILAEFFGGLAVLFGVLARLAALTIAIDMLVAMLLVHAPNGFFNGGPNGAGIEFTLMLFASATAIMIAGPGRYAVAPDLETRLLRRRHEPEPMPRHA
jgi:putative oxidoreductase